MRARAPLFFNERLGLLPPTEDHTEADRRTLAVFPIVVSQSPITDRIYGSYSDFCSLA
jgi:hypothetical protein